MRMIVIKQGTDMQALALRVLGSGAAREGAVQGLQRLNPHIDFNRIEPGSVVLVPDQPGAREGESASVSGEAFAAFSEQAKAAVDGAVARVRSGHEARLAEQKDVATVLKAPTLKRLLEADPDLKKELDAALQGFKDDQQAAKESERSMKILQDQVTAELAALGKLLG